MDEKLVNEKQDSVKLNRTSKGVYSWEIKRYYNGEKTTVDEMISKLQEIDEKMKRNFGGQ